MSELLNIVDDNDEIIGEKTREEIHRTGLLHREVHVYFVTPNRELIFQHRDQDKDLYPDLLDATVGGHVGLNQSYEEAAIRETEEETGVKISAGDLMFVNKMRGYFSDRVNGKLNNIFSSRYLYIYRGDLRDLRVETGKAIDFKVYSLEKLINLSVAEKTKFIPYILTLATGDLAAFIKDMKL